uniref:C-type lectin domain-containing protein n=1 Tax=Terrapene triunguis TaxID=2587831 RepID=A0A674JJ84_9SAUR
PEEGSRLRIPSRRKCMFMFSISFLLASPSVSPWRLSAIILGPVCLILLILVIVMALQGECFIDYKAASCYSFSTSAKSWHKSLDACTAMSASLVKIDTKKELVQSLLCFSSLSILVVDKTITYTLTLLFIPVFTLCSF